MAVVVNPRRPHRVFGHLLATRLFRSGISADPQIVADEITRIIGLEPGTRPRRSVADGSDYGAAEELRRRLARRMHIGALLGNEAKTASPPVETV